MVATLSETSLDSLTRREPDRFERETSDLLAEQLKNVVRCLVCLGKN